MCGLWNGVLIARLGIQPIVATLILYVAGRGVAQMITNGKIVRVFYEPFFVAGVVYAFYMLSGYGLNANGFELDIISSVGIGGTLLSGGYGYVIGIVFGVLIQGIIQNIITFDGTLNSWWTRIVVGLLTLLFIVMQRGF